MPQLEEQHLNEYFSKVLEAVEKGDKDALKRFGQQEGFLSNSIRKLAW
jgi:hypothetical protein